MTLFEFNYLFKDPVSKYSHILRYQELELQHTSLGGHNQSITDTIPQMLDTL